MSAEAAAVLESEKPSEIRRLEQLAARLEAHLLVAARAASLESPRPLVALVHPKAPLPHESGNGRVHHP